MIIVDTGILVAVANRADRWHQQATELLRSRQREMIVPAPVIVESAWLIARELGNRAEAAFIAAMGRGELQVEDLQLAVPARQRSVGHLPRQQPWPG